MNEEISMETTIIEAGPKDSISVHTYCGDKGGRTGKHIMIQRRSEQPGMPESTEKHSVNDLRLALDIMVSNPGEMGNDT